MRLPRLPWSKLTTPPGTRGTFPRCTLLDARSLTSGESAQAARTEALPSHRRAIFGTRTSPSCCRPSRERPAPGDSLRPSDPRDARCRARRPGGVCGGVCPGVRASGSPRRGCLLDTPSRATGGWELRGWRHRGVNTRAAVPRSPSSAPAVPSSLGSRELRPVVQRGARCTRRPPVTSLREKLQGEDIQDGTFLCCVLASCTMELIPTDELALYNMAPN
ncbi:uncharacterized protein [Vulpes vulpes]|uniref:Uncharacterized protein n=1 Tax=Vulpes vulpes TaxID=9627 RepID=A0A3Q7SKB9_VULVU|nr:uncharacterized protein LOC112910338 [Vulpes vulpes]